MLSDNRYYKEVTVKKSQWDKSTTKISQGELTHGREHEWAESSCRWETTFILEEVTS